MSEKPATTVREALMQQALEDIDALIQRLSIVDAEISQKVESAVKTALGKSFLDVQLRYEAMTREESQKIIIAGHEAASEIRKILDAGGIRMLLNVVNGKISTILYLVIGTVIFSGVVGGLIGFMLFKSM